MAAKKRTDEHENIQEGAEDGTFDAAAEPEDFYEAEVLRYTETLKSNQAEAFERYGFTLYHSLAPRDQINLSQDLGFFRNDAVDQYNLAGLEISEENYEKAATLLEKALGMDDSLGEATCNLALCYEKLDRKDEAAKLWAKYREMCTDCQEELDAIDSHLAEAQA
jgi:tetratricopeptide (TPR) repeat protein